MHIHVPDGVLPVWLWAAGFVLLALALAFTLRRTRSETKRMPVAAMMTAIMILTMSVPLGLPIHINFSVLAGLLLGAHWALLAALIVNALLAGMGHGGVTLIGINTLLVWFEAVAGIFMLRLLQHQRAGVFIATLAALLLSALLFFGIIAISTTNPGILSVEEFGELNLSLPAFIILSAPLALAGAVIEAVMTAAIISYLKRYNIKLGAI